MNKTCPSCKREIDENEQFCPFCAAFVGEEKEDKPRVTIDDLKASPVTSEALHNLSKDAKITNAEPEIKNIELKITAKRPTDDAPWDEEKPLIQEETTVVEKEPEPEPVVEEIKKRS